VPRWLLWQQAPAHWPEHLRRDKKPRMANEMSAPALLAPDATLVLGNNDDDFSAGHDSDATLSPETARLYRVEEEEESQRPDYRHAEYPPKYVGWQGNVRRAIPGVDFPLDDMPKGKEDLWYPIDELNALEKAAHAENETTEKTMDSAEKGQQRTGTEDETVQNCQMCGVVRSGSWTTSRRKRRSSCGRRSSRS
jgi:hypothetical protein